ncbi:MAG TPA: YojF family protein [Bacillota bacterium]|nr:YojF family protein [Bacillota bacterium]
MEPIDMHRVQEILDTFVNKDVYIHIETTNGAYASHFDHRAYNVGAYVRNAKVRFSRAKLVGNGNVYRAGLKMADGWIYAEGLTDWTMHDDTKLLLAGHDREGRLMVSLQIGTTPFDH